ncbi:MAG TPA: hypothetical protein V6D20_13190 [Candidatus Obscuribacterales bacterium]
MNPLNENNGKPSSIRLGMFICIITGCYVAIAGLHLDRSLLELLPMSLGLISAGFTAKVMQKPKEQ